MALTKQQIFEAMKSETFKRKPTPTSQPKKDNFSDLVTKLKEKKKSD